MGKDGTICKPRGFNFFRQFSLRWYYLVVGIGAIILALGAMLGDGGAQSNTAGDDLLPIEELGKRVFFDNISNPPRMSCSTCHNPSAG